MRRLACMFRYLKPGDGPIMLVLAPTRELAVQIQEEVAKFGSSSSIKHTCALHCTLRVALPRVFVLLSGGSLFDGTRQRQPNTQLVLTAWKMLLYSGSSPASHVPADR